MFDRLPKQPNSLDTGIINLDNNSGSGTHWVAYAVDPRAIVYFDLYGLAPAVEFLKYVGRTQIPIWYSTLPMQTMTDPSRCGREAVNVFSAISKCLPLHKTVHLYTSNTYNG